MIDVKNKLYQSTKQRAARYCSYQERTVADVQDKLLRWGVTSKAERDSLIQELEDEQFIDEKRYVTTFVRGRFNIKKWGRRKIYHELTQKSLDQALIQQGLDLIEEADYLNTINHLALRKRQQLHLQDLVQVKKKLITYLLQKGYEPELIQKTIEHVLAT